MTRSSSSSPLLLGSDLGTGSCKTVLLDTRGAVLASAAQEYPSHHPHPDWVEQDPEAWYQAFCATTRQVLADSGASPAAIAAICIVGVTHNPVLLDRADKVLRPSIHFWDRRSSAQVAELEARWGAEIERRARNGVDVLWTWPQLLWVRQHEPEVWSQVATLLFPKDYVRHRLAPSRVSDTVDPAGTLLYDPERSSWIEPFVADLGLDPTALPEPLPPLAVAGRVSAEGANDTGLIVGTPVLAGTTDTAAEVFGAGALQAGQAVVKLSSVGRLMVTTTGPMPGSHRLNYPHVLPGLWYPGSVTKYGAAAYRWAREALWPDLPKERAYRLMDDAAGAVPAGSDGVLFHPHLLGEFAPQWDPRLRASFTGVTVHHHRAHLTRAVLEGVAFQVRAALEDLEAAGASWETVRLIGGGADSPLWAQILSDVLGLPLRVPRYRSAAYGAAILAGVGSGLFPTEAAELQAFLPLERDLRPSADAAAYDACYLDFRRMDALLASFHENA